MPSSVTHSYFAMDVYKGLNQTCQKKIQNYLGDYKLFAQGSDPFMFYHFLLGKKAQKMKQLQNRMHHEKTQAFFLSILQFIQQNQLQQDAPVMSYLYGHICHYYLDAFTHPFIYYKSGIFNPNDEKTYRYNGVHQKMEYQIDAYLIEQRETIDPRRFRMDQFIFENHDFSPSLKKLIQKSIGEVYGVSNVVFLYKRAIWYMKKFFRWFNYDPYGWKLKVYREIDRHSSPRLIRLEELSFYTPYSKEIDYLNVKHQKWYSPWNRSACFTTSFLDLYEKAKKQAIQTIEEVTLLLDSDRLEEKKIKKIFLNWSYATGVDCNQKIKMKYFEF